MALAAVTGGATGRLHLGDHARFAPARRAAGPPAGPVRHVSVVVARPPTDGEGPDPVAVLGPGALAAAEQLAGATVAALTVHRPAAGRAVVDLRLTDGGTGSLDLAFDDAAVWQAQVASDDEVVTVELAPLPVAERNGDPLPVDPGPPTRDRRLVDLGYLDQLRVLADVHADAAPAHVEDVRRLRLLETD